ncbi:MAG: hypothetical protein WC979_01305 [Candidatus Pacearchaeota archaeon]|jgi:hypothetical protein|nr:hypothetical protein [Clostridia bacterium]
MEKRIPSLDDFINESSNKIKTVRPIKEILKDFRKSKYYNHIGIFEIEQWGRVTALAANSDTNKELAAIFLTDGNDPSTDHEMNKLGEKLSDAWEKLFTLDSNMITMRDEHLKKVNAKYNN